MGAGDAGAVSGTMNTAGLVGGFTCTILVGYIVKLTGNYNLPLLAIGTMLLMSASLSVRIDATQQLEVDGRS